MNNTVILRILQQITTWSILPGVLYLFYLNEIQYYVLVFLSIIFISKFGASIGQHRYFTHKSFKMSLPKEIIISFLATLSTTGSTLQYVSVHRYHHANSDNGKDLHSPHEIGYWKSFFHWYDKTPSTLIPISSIKDLLKKPHLMFFHKYYFLIIFFYVLILTLIDINLVVFCYLIPAGFSWWSSGVLSLPLHLPSQGYRNFNTQDTTVNSHIWNWLTLGEGLHNNHHARPGEYNFAFTKKPWEWDICKILVDKFLK